MLSSYEYGRVEGAEAIAPESEAQEEEQSLCTCPAEINEMNEACANCQEAYCQWLDAERLQDIEQQTEERIAA